MQVVHVYIIPHVKIYSISIRIDVIVELVIPVEIVKLVRRTTHHSLIFFLLQTKAIVTSCERTPCIHGQCLKIDLYTEVCICEANWIGIDCSQAISSENFFVMCL